MKHCALMLAVLPILAACGMTRIVTVSPNPGYTDTHTYSTTVTVPRTHTVTTVTNVSTYDRDIALHLDLQAVTAAFAQSSTIQEFEYLINNSSYMISNLDLNLDGYVDYLRVMETMEGRNHVFVIQAVLAPNVYQDVATLVAQIPSPDSYYVQIIGAPYVYGPSYVLQPVFITRPPIFAYLVRPGYRPWNSPWYWSHYPSCYKRPVPIVVSHYQEYVRTYMHNHRYCHEFHYMDRCRYPDYDRISRPVQRNDYGVKYPERSFTVRNANTSKSSSNPVVNARDIENRRQAASTRTTTSSQAKTGTNTSSGSTVRSSGNSSSNIHSSASRSSATSTMSTTSRSATASSSSSSQTMVRSRVGSAGTQSTTRSSTTAGQTTVNTSSPVRSSSSSGSSSSARSTPGSGSSSSTRSSSNSSSNTRSYSNSSSNTRSRK